MKGAEALLLVICFANSVAVTVLCQNGGIHDGLKCLCDDTLFHGPKCEYPNDDVPVEVGTVEMAVEVQVKITNMVFDKDLENKSSVAYTKLELQFKEEMRKVYKAVPGYKDVVILALWDGSIVVDHKVIIETDIKNNVSNIDAILSNVTDSVMQQLTDMNSTNKECNTTSALCLSAPPNPILNATAHFSAEEQCKKFFGPKYGDYYYPNTTTGTLRCMSKCTKGTSETLNCNYGDCQVSESGAQCNCRDSDSFWYTDGHCLRRIHKDAVGFGVALAALVVVSTILAIFFYRAKRRKSGSRERTQKQDFPAFS